MFEHNASNLSVNTFTKWATINVLHSKNKICAKQIR